VSATPEETTIRVTPITELKALVDLLYELDLAPLHLHVDGRHELDDRADIRLWMTTRTQFEHVCKALGATAREATSHHRGERIFHAEVDTETRKLLVSCHSLDHHADWQPKGASA
jgi:hypothetical protein